MLINSFEGELTYEHWQGGLTTVEEVYWNMSNVDDDFVEHVFNHEAFSW